MLSTCFFNGNIWVDENTTRTLCVWCGSSEHAFPNCRADDQLRQQITLAFDLVKTAIESHPDVLPSSGSSPAPRPQRGERATGSNDNMDVESVASSGRRPKAKARPRRRELHHPEGMFIVKYDNGMNLSDAVHRRRGGLQQRLWRRHFSDRSGEPRRGPRMYPNKHFAK